MAHFAFKRFAPSQYIYSMAEDILAPLSVGDLVIFRYEQINPEAKIGLVLKREMRAMPVYTLGGYDEWMHDPLEPIIEEVWSCYCHWAGTKLIDRWWTPEKNLILLKERKQ